MQASRPKKGMYLDILFAHV